MLPTTPRFSVVLSRLGVGLVLLGSIALISHGVHAQPVILTLFSPSATPWRFGLAVATGDLNGDGKDEIAIGAPNEDVGANSLQGRVYVFDGNGALVYTLNTPNPQPFATFGASVAMADVNGNGTMDIIVGSPSAQVGTNAQQGRVHVFNGLTGTVFAFGTYTTPDPQNAPNFGRAVVGADLNGDGKAEVIASAPGTDVGINAQQGRVYAIDANALSLMYTFDTPDPEPNAGFGISLATGDVDGDLVPDVVVGSPNQQPSGVYGGGRVHVFSGANGNLLRNLVSPNLQPSSEFGISVASADVDLDGQADIAAGAPGETVSGVQAQGRAYIISGATSAPIHTLTTPIPQGAYFGATLAFGDVNLDTYADLLVGSPSEKVASAPLQGQAYLFSGLNGSVLTAITTPNVQTGGQNSFGWGTGTADVDGNGSIEMVETAIGETVSSMNNAGRAYVFLYDPAQTCPGGDCDGDGASNGNDNCEFSFNPLQPNTDAASLDNGPMAPGNDATILNADALGDACDLDADNDGLPDTQETAGPPCASASTTTDRLLMDTDGDHLTDGWECAHGSDPASAASKFLGTGTTDADGDNVPDVWEQRGYNGSSSSTDSDGDGCWDMVEVASIDGNKTVNDTDRLAVARRALGIWPPNVAQDYALDISKNGVVDDPDRIFVARAALMPAPWVPKSCP